MTKQNGTIILYFPAVLYYWLVTSNARTLKTRARYDTPPAVRHPSCSAASPLQLNAEANNVSQTVCDTYVSRDEFCRLRGSERLRLSCERQSAVGNDWRRRLTLKIMMKFRAQTIRSVAVWEVSARLDVLVWHAVRIVNHILAWNDPLANSAFGKSKVINPFNASWSKLPLFEGFIAILVWPTHF